MSLGSIVQRRFPRLPERVVPQALPLDEQPASPVSQPVPAGSMWLLEGGLALAAILTALLLGFSR